jgi:hypothetical protein
MHVRALGGSRWLQVGQFWIYRGDIARTRLATPNGGS